MRFSRRYLPPNGSAHFGLLLLIDRVSLICASATHAFLPIAITATVAATAQAQIAADRAFGFGSLHVNFQTQPATVLGFAGDRSQLTNASVATQSDPVTYVGNYGRVAEANSSVPAVQSVNLPIVNDGVGSLIDFGDLHTFNIGFEHLTVGDSFGLQTVDVCGVYWLTGGDKRTAASSRLFTPSPESVRSTQEFEITSVEAGDASQLDNFSPITDDSPTPSAFVSGIRTQNSGIAFVYGLRSYTRRDAAGLDATGGILGKTSLRTTAENEVFAPQAGLAWLTTRGNWLFQVQSTALAGHNDVTVEQQTRFGEELIPGALNRPLLAKPVFTNQLESHQAFSPGAEIRAETRYFITDALSFHLAWSGLFFENMRMPDKIPDLSTRLLAPDSMHEDAGDQYLFTQDLYCGIEYLR